MDDWDEEAELENIAKFNTLLRTFGSGCHIVPYREGPGYELREWVPKRGGGTEEVSVYEDVDRLEARVHKIIERLQAARFNSVSSV